MCLRNSFHLTKFPLFLTFVFLSASLALASNANVIPSSRNDVSPPFSQIADGNSVNPGGTDTQTPTARSTGAVITNPNSDPTAAPFAGPLTGVTGFFDFEGQSTQDQRTLFGFAFVPPDTNGAVGATQYVQMVNVTIAVYDKSSGTLQLGPAAIHTLWSGFGGLCEFGGGTPTDADGGDPVVLYDHLAGRWLVTQLQYDTTFTHTAECIAVSNTSDATGSYNRYEYDFGTNFPDYPKFSVWPDAYYNSINIYPPHSFAGPEACAFDRKAMLIGRAASAICFQQPSTVSSLLPADLDGGTLPPTGSPNYVVGLADSTHLNLFKFHVDFRN